MEKLRLGFAGIGQPTFTGDKEGELGQAIDFLTTLAHKHQFTLIPYPQLVQDKEGAVGVLNMMEDEGVSFLLVQNSSFAPGTLINILSQGDYYLGLWALQEGSRYGPLPFNSFCGSNMNGAILKGKKESRPFKWFYGPMEGELFYHRLMITIRAMKAIEALKKLSIGVIVGTAPGFVHLEYCKGEISERFGTQVEIIGGIQEIIKRADHQPKGRVQKECQALKEGAKEVLVKEVFVEKTARYVLALQDIASEGGFGALAVRCWPDTNREYGLFPCSAIGRLNEVGLPASCEGDVYGVLGMALLNSLNGRGSILLDLVDFQLEEEGVYFWHCGNGSRDFAHKGLYQEDYHFNNQAFGMVRDMRLKAMEATIINIGRNGEAIFTFSGHFKGGEGGFHGTGGYCSSLKDVKGPLLVKDLMGSIYQHGLSHHYAVGFGDYLKEIKELMGWLGIKGLDPIPYQAYL